ncbi:hypothetical protein IAI10_17540 [Clostridium sp. 19966]|uniref:hypothetical protein n=1 Tax=Clostridium sp. 19966 TaxID=2768166 RepID=UPI0028E054B0|nr:hypothetical protein [Clostridium sp. 19966]MDT8718471.1 hypothetical protein [Clostridium sp. 19966]
MSNKEIYLQVDRVVRGRLLENQEELDSHVEYIQKIFDDFYTPLMKNLLKIFNINWNEKESEITCFLGCYPVFPRDVISKEFWVNFNSSDEKIIKGSIHEIDHFVLFEKWKSMHGYDKRLQPQHPETLWFLEELSVDPTLNEKSIQEITPYQQLA